MTNSEDDLGVHVNAEYEAFLSIGAECLKHGPKILVYEPEVGLMCVDCVMEREDAEP